MNSVLKGQEGGERKNREGKAGGKLLPVCTQSAESWPGRQVSAVTSRGRSLAAGGLETVLTLVFN